MPLDDITKFMIRSQIEQGGKKKAGKAPAWLYPWNAERKYEKELIAYVRDLGTIVKENLDLYAIIREAAQVIPGRRLDDWSDQIDNSFSIIAGRIDIAETNAILVATQTAENVNAINAKEWLKTMHKVFGVNIFIQEPWLEPVSKAFVSENVTLIKSLTQDSLKTVKRMVSTGVTNGTSTRDITKQIVNYFSSGELKQAEGFGLRPVDRARLIARDQVGKLNGQLTQYRQQGIGVEKYIWRDSGDQRVRPRHQELDSQTFSWGDPPDEGNPGEPIQCRCYGEGLYQQVFDDLGIR